MKDLNIDNPIDDLKEIKKYIGKTFVIKFGGSIINNTAIPQTFIEDVERLIDIGINIIIVHGGGPEISRWIEKLGFENKFIKGLRVTDNSIMEVVEMVLSGHINKNISANLSSKGLNAIGLSGKDANLIQAKKKYIYENGKKLDIGFVGEVVNINKKLLFDLLEKKHIPVISPIGCDSSGSSYNINADYAASFISGVLEAEKLIIMTDINGVYKDINDPSTLLSSITINEIYEYIKCGIIKGGMIPKMECCIDALKKGTKNIHLINGEKDHSLINDIFKDCGTKIIRGSEYKICKKIV